MGRKEITAGLSALLEQRFARNAVKYAREVELMVGGDSVRVDYMSYQYPVGCWYRNTSAELGTLTVYEVKSCMDDFKSGHGLGFVGDRNVLVCPAALAEELIGSRKLPYDVDEVLAPVRCGTAVDGEYAGEIDGFSLKKIFGRKRRKESRAVTTAYGLAQMLYAIHCHGDFRGTSC